MLRAYSVILIHVVIGIGILTFSQHIDVPSWLDVSIFIFIFFLIVNIADRYLFHLEKEMRRYWSIRAVPYFIVGVVVGMIIACTPFVFSYVTGKPVLETLRFNMTSLAALAGTFFIVAWEELWFRGIFLNHCRKSLSPIHLSIVIGCLFAGVHMLNPEMDFIQEAPALISAGALLTLLYLKYKTIWLPLGIHFGNNIFSSFIQATGKTYKSDNFVEPIVLTLLFVIVLLTKWREDVKTEYQPAK